MATRVFQPRPHVSRCQLLANELAILGSCSHDISLQLQAGSTTQPPTPEASAAAGDVKTDQLRARSAM